MSAAACNGPFRQASRCINRTLNLPLGIVPPLQMPLNLHLANIAKCCAGERAITPRGLTPPPMPAPWSTSRVKSEPLPRPPIGAAGSATLHRAGQSEGQQPTLLPRSSLELAVRHVPQVGLRITISGTLPSADP